MIPFRALGLLSGTSLLAVCAPVRAQQEPAPPSNPAPETVPPVAPVGSDGVYEGEGIVITGRHLPGEVDTDIPVELELDEQDVASYGASSIGDLLAALGPQTGSARGRGDGQPVVLINGQRVSGFRELRDLPPEAIQRVQVFPEELALQYGYRPDQRVINFILKPNFRSLSAEAGYGFATQGDYETNELDATFTQIGKKDRINLNADFEPTSRLLEADRDIIQSRTDALGLVDEGRFRTLTPDTHPLELSASLSRNLGTQTNLSLTASYDRTRTLSLLGLPAATFTVPGQVERVTRLFAADGALERTGKTDSIEVGANANGQLGQWRWTAGATYTHGLNRSFTDRQANPAALIAGVASGALDPLDPGLTLPSEGTTDTTRSLSGRSQATATLSGSPFRLPAGEAQLTLTADARLVTLASRASGREVSDVSLNRRGGVIRSNLVLPVTSRQEGFGDAIGTLSLNANGGVQELSDFGRLTEYGYGLTWEPVEKLSLIASVIGEQAAPSLTQLGAPQLLTPNAPVFDGRLGRTVFADVLTGGNPNLQRESRRDLKLSATYSRGERRDSSFVVEYLKNRSDNVTAAFPLLTPAIEAAFPDRVSRDATGALLRLDSRPVTFDRLRSDRIRFGFSLSGSLGAEPEGETITIGGPGGGSSRAGRGRPEGSTRGEGAPAGGTGSAASRPASGGGRRGTPATDGTAPAPGAGVAARPDPDATPPATEATPRARPPGGGGRFGGRGRGGRWNVSVYDVWQLNNRVLIGPGVPELDLLGGDVTDGSTPVSRHQVQLEGGLFKDGLGLRVTGAYTGRAILSDGGTGLSGGSATDLRFGDLFTLSARIFINFDQRQNVIDAVPFLKGSRLSLRADNLFGGARRVTDPFGATPLAYQPGFLDPRGRFLEVSLRKRF